MAAAADWLTNIGFDNLSDYEKTLLQELLRVAEIPGIRILGPDSLDNRIASVSFTVDGVHPHDVGQVLDDAGVAVRVGRHCAQPIHNRFGVSASVRASATIYNTVEEIAAFREALAQVRPFFGIE